MLTKPHELPPDTKDVLIQHYVDDPYLINGFKFDMRIYVAATCFDPLRLYVFTDGLARFATEPYSQDKADLKWVPVCRVGREGGGEGLRG
jgi:hypothetical protein